MTRDQDEGSPPAEFLSAADVPAAVRAAVAAFAAPRGFEDFPTPTKNSAQRSLIYFYGRRVRQHSDHVNDAPRPESKWFCLASPQCRANGTAISTTANISGCTRHLQVFHGLVSPKTVQMAKKAGPNAAGKPDGAREARRPIAVTTSAATNGRATCGGDARESPTQLDQDSGDAQRAARLEWARVMVVRHLFPLAALVNDEQVARLLTPSPLAGDPDGNCELAEVEVLHHLVECYAATHDHLRELVQRELARATLPILHVGLLSTSVPGSPSSCGRMGDATTALTLLGSFVTSTFRLQQFVLGVTHANGVQSQPRAAVSGVLRWVKAVLGGFGIASANVRSFVLEQSSPLSGPLAAALSTDDEAVNHGLGRQSVEFSCDSVAISALSAACARGSCLRQLITKLHAIAISPGVHCMDIDVEPLEELAACLGERNPANDISFAKLCAPSTWIAVGRVLRWVVRHWQEIESMVGMTANAPSDHHQSTPLDLTRADLQQSLAVLQPVLDSLHSGLTTGRSRGEKCAGCPEAVVSAFTARLSALNELEPLQLVHVAMSADRENGCVEDDGGVENENATVVRPADVTGFARKLRHELASRWDVAIQEGVYQADNACLSTFLHPCFRHLEFMDKARRATILEQVKTLGRTAVINQRRQLGPPVSTPNSGSSDHPNEGDTGNGLRLLKKRKTTTEMTKHERLAHQAEALARLGLLKMAKTLAPPPEQSTVGAASGDDQSNSTGNAALALTCSSPAFLIANELDRYMQNESIAFQAVAFDETLTYWDRKAFEFPILAAVAKAVSGAPRSLRAVCRASSYAGHGGCCVRCSLRKCQHRKLTSSHSSSNTSASGYDGRVTGQRLEEVLFFLHLNEKFVPATPFVPSLSRESVIRVLEELAENSSARIVDTAGL